MIRQIDHDYYEWLISQIAVPNNKSYNDLFERMHNSEFVWTVPRDDNRVQDGLDLRGQYLNEFGRRGSRLNLGGVTLLEILISLSRRVAFTAGGNEREWAWRLLENLHLNKASDPLIGKKAERVEETLYALVWRTYQWDGQGGFFPLKHAVEDQTKVEIWYQMNAYVIEMHEL
jgi:hypothetical protein